MLFQARQRYFASSASFLPILFWQDRKEWAAGGILRLRRRKDIPQGIKNRPAGLAERSNFLIGLCLRLQVLLQDQIDILGDGAVVRFCLGLDLLQQVGIDRNADLFF